jgi:hypothetical protein
MNTKDNTKDNNTMFRERNCKKPAHRSEADPLIEEGLVNWFRDEDFSVIRSFPRSKFTRETYDVLKHEFLQ